MARSKTSCLNVSGGEQWKSVSLSSITVHIFLFKRLNLKDGGGTLLQKKPKTSMTYKTANYPEKLSQV